MEDTQDYQSRLTALIHHEDETLRAGVAAALGRLGDMKSVEPLLELLADPVHIVHQAAARALARLGEPAVGSVLAVIQDPPVERVAARASDTLALVRDAGAVDMLIASLGYPEEDVRHGAADALGEIGDERSVEALIKAVRHSDVVTRQKAAAALVKLASPELIHTFATLLGEEDARLREIGVEGLGVIGNEETVLPLLTALDDPAENVQQEAALALQNLQDIQSIDMLLTTLQSNSARIRQTIAEALGNIPHPDTIEALHAVATEDGDLQTRLNAAQSLVNLGDARGEKMILRTLNAPNTETRRLAAIALGNTGDPRAAQVILTDIKGLQTDTSKGRLLRQRMVRALLTVGQPAIPALINRLASSEAPRRQLASDALVAMGSPAVDRLVDHIRVSRLPAVRRRIAQVLGRIGDAQAAAPLEEILRLKTTGMFAINFYASLIGDPLKPVRIAAAEALAQIGMPASGLPLLLSARFDPDKDVRFAAKQALAAIGEPETILRYADLDWFGTANRAVVSGLTMILAAFLSAMAIRSAGLPGAALFGGLLTGAGIGISDGLAGRIKAHRWVLAGALLAVFLPWVAGLTLGNSLPEVVGTILGIVLPAAGAVYGWQRVNFFQRLAGLFTGMVLGFLSAGLAILLLGTIS